MTTLLDRIDARPATAGTPPEATPAQRLRATMAAVRLSFTWMGTRKTLDADQKARAAEAFGAEGQYLSAGKKLLDTRHPAFRAVTAVRGKVGAYWKGLSLPYPEPGVRLIRQDKVEDFVRQMADSKAELDDAVANLDRHFGELKRAAAERLGSLFNAADYPESLVGLFDVQWDFPGFEPPDYLRLLCPAVYEQERARVAARFDEAVQLAEEAFTDQFAQLVAHLTERISGAGDGGEPKVFRDSAVGNLVEFFERFRSLSVRSNEQLDQLVSQAQRAVRGVAARDPRDSGDLRQRVAAQLSGVRSALDGLLVERPRRRILRQATAPGGRLMRLVVAPTGRVRAIYSEDIDLATLGRPVIARASHVEPGPDGRWRADLSPVSGPVLGPFARRSEWPSGKCPSFRDCKLKIVDLADP
jgi:hypothetical protein